MSSFGNLSSRASHDHSLALQMKKSLETSGSIDRHELGELEKRVDGFVKEYRDFGKDLNTEALDREASEIVPPDLKLRQDEFAELRNQVISLTSLVEDLKVLAGREVDFSTKKERIQKEFADLRKTLDFVDDIPDLQSSIDNMQKLKESIPTPKSPEDEAIAFSLFESINKWQEKFAAKITKINGIEEL